MSAGFRRNAAAITGLSLLCALGLGGWEQLNSGTVAYLSAVHFPEGTQVGYAVGGVSESLGGLCVVVKTTDRGASWQTQNVELHGMLNSVYFRDNKDGFAVGAAGMAIRTTDGGANWTAMAVPDSGVLNSIQFPENGQIGYIGLYPHDGGSRVLKSTDGGDNWTSIIISGPLSTSRSCGMATDDIGVVVGDSGSVMATTDGGSTFAVQGPLTIADLTAAAFSPTDPLRGYLIGNDSTHGLIRHTDDGGANLWDSVRCPVIVAFYGVDVPTSEAAYVCGTDGFIGKTLSPTYVRRTDAPSGVTVTLRGLCFPHGADTGFAVGAQGVILRTYDGGSAGWVAEDKAAAGSRATVRVVPNPARHGIAFHADAEAKVTVFDAAGRVAVSRAAVEGMNFLPLSKAGVYMVKVETDGFSTTQKLVVEH